MKHAPATNERKRWTSSRSRPNRETLWPSARGVDTDARDAASGPNISKPWSAKGWHRQADAVPHSSSTLTNVRAIRAVRTFRSPGGRER